MFKSIRVIVFVNTEQCLNGFSLPVALLQHSIRIEPMHTYEIGFIANSNIWFEYESSEVKWTSCMHRNYIFPPKDIYIYRMHSF